MRECAWVRVIVEKEEYARKGVHKGMVGIILLPQIYEGEWLVGFDQEDLSMIDLSILESDIELLE